MATVNKHYTKISHNTHYFLPNLFGNFISDLSYYVYYNILPFTNNLMIMFEEKTQIDEKIAK